MDTWDTLIAQAKETERCARIARENIEEHAKYWRKREPTKVQVCPVKEGAPVRQRGRLFDGIPKLQS